MSSSNDNELSSSSMRGNSRKISVTIRAQDGTLTRCKVGADLPCKELFKQYCGDNDLKYRSIAFLYDGRRINKHSRTFEELGFGHEVEIDAMEHVSGGGEGI